MTTKDELPILDRAYSDRQLIFVADDLVAKLAHGEKLGLIESRTRALTRVLKFTAAEFINRVKTRDWKKIAASIPIVYLKMMGEMISESGKEGIRAWVKLMEGGIKIQPVGKTEAQRLTFPPGHPREHVLYVGHPTISTVYYPMADFHRFTFEHKFCEAIELLMSLGARYIRVEHVTGWSKDFSARLSVPLAMAADSATVNASQSSAGRRNLLYEAYLAGTHKPSLPQRLDWYPYEQTWQAIAKGRMAFGLNNFSLSLSYEDDLGINARLKAAALKAGLEIGGKFEDHQSTVWRLEGKFKGT
jgi:hypothetical protein